MERNTVLAVILSAIVITVGFTIQATFFPPEQPEVSQEVQPEETVRTDDPTDEETQPREPVYRPENIEDFDLVALGEDPAEEQVRIDNGVVDAVFSSRGAVLQSYRLTEHLDDGEPVEAIFSSAEDQGAFYLYLGEQFQEPMDDLFHVRKVDDLTVEFYRDFSYRRENGEVEDEYFTVTKRFEFKPNEYLFETSVRIENSVRGAPPLDFDGFAYTIGFEPQLGPPFQELDARYEYRNFYTYAGGSKDSVRIRDGRYMTDEFLAWTSLSGKYFSVIGIPDSTRYRTTLIEDDLPGLPQASKIMYTRPALRNTSTHDVFRFYIGPQQTNAMSIYNRTSENAWGLRDMYLEEAIETSSWFGWLETILKFFLNLFYQIVPNYGIAIILLTILIKVVLYPLTKKSHESTAKMQALNPKIQELKEQYKGDQQKMNQAMAELYKQEKINPLSMGCLPMLLQFPIFIALYGLLNSHFELRGATFISGWITDLSAPDSIINFAPLQIPMLGWSDIRLLPIIYLATMVLSFKISTQATAASSGQMNMKFMTVGMPIVLFFVLYNAPSGLLLYWTVMNIITMLQQRYITKKRHYGTPDQKQEGPKLAPTKGKGGGRKTQPGGQKRLKGARKS